MDPWKFSDLFRSPGGQSCSCADTEGQHTLIIAVTFEQVPLTLKMANLLVLPPVVGVPKCLLKPDPSSYEFNRWGFWEVAKSPGLWLLNGLVILQKRVEGACPLLPPREENGRVLTVCVEQVSSRH